MLIAASTITAHVGDGLHPAIDAVAARAPASHRFLRRGWYAAALEAYGGTARTLLVEADGAPTLALPWIGTGPRVLRVASVPGSYWPFRTLVAAADADARVYDAALATLARHVRALRIGPVGDDDPAAAALIAAAHANGWTLLDRYVARRWMLDLTPGDEPWPRASTLKKNRWHEKQLAAEGALDWRVDVADWPAAFDTLAAVEATSWQAGGDAKFTDTAHGRFWRAAARDPAIAAAMRAAVLWIGGKPAAFSFDLDAGTVTHAVANSYDPAHARHSPGKLLQYRNLVAARDRGVRVIDWGAGDSGYKATLGAVAGPPLRDWLLIAPGPLAIAARAARGWWRRSGNADG